MSFVDTGIVAMKTITLMLGGLITYFAYRASRRTDSVALRALTLGFAVITGGAILAGALNQFAGLRLQLSVLIQSVATALGFAIITYSLYVEE